MKNAEQWAEFCEDWSETVLALIDHLDDQKILGEAGVAAKANRSLCFPPASNEEISEAEARLGFRLPLSYRGFLSHTNGFLLMDMDPGTGRLLRVEEVGLYKKLYNKKFTIFADIEATTCDEEYFVYGKKQDPVNYRTSYANSLIAISTHFSTGVYLLNPEVVCKGNEFEAWAFNFHGGATRARSFSDLMVLEKDRSIAGLQELILSTQ